MIYKKIFQVIQSAKKTSSPKNQKKKQNPKWEVLKLEKIQIQHLLKP